MNSVNKALIGVLIAQVILAVITLSQVDPNKLRKLKLLVPDFNRETVERIDVFKRAKGDGPAPTEPDLSMAKENGIWLAKNFFDYPINPENVKIFFDKLQKLASRGPIASGETRQTQLAVTDDKFERKVIVHRSGGLEPLTFYIGKAAGGRKIAVRQGGSDDIHGIAKFGPSSAQYAVLGWVDSTYFETTMQDIVGIDVETAAGRWVVSRKDSESLWRLAGAPPDHPDGAIAEPQPGVPTQYLVQRPFDNVARQMALIKFNEPASPQIPRGSALAKITLTIVQGNDEAEAKPEPQRYSFLIGPEMDGRYVVSRDNARPVWIYINNFESIVNLSKQTVFSLKPQPNFSKRSREMSKIPRMGGSQPGPHGGAGAHGGGAGAGAGPHGGGASGAGAGPHGAGAGGAGAHGGGASGANPSGAAGGANPHGGAPAPGGGGR